MNLLEETIAVLAEYNLSLDDIARVQGYDFEIPVENFIEVAKNTNYDDGFGSAKIAQDLLVIGNGWWLERGEYDGSEWWEFKQPYKPIERTRAVTSLGDDSIMWNSLKEINDKENNNE